MRNITKKEWGIVGSQIGAILIIVALMSIISIETNNTYATDSTNTINRGSSGETKYDCLEGYYRDDNGECQICPEGYYCMGNKALPKCPINAICDETPIFKCQSGYTFFNDICVRDGQNPSTATKTPLVIAVIGMLSMGLGTAIYFKGKKEIITEI